MIAFLSKEFFVIDKSWAVMTNVAKYYDSETHSKDILMVYEGDMYYGMICHESYLKYSRCDADDYILKCYYVHKLFSIKCVICYILHMRILMVKRSR